MSGTAYILSRRRSAAPATTPQVDDARRAPKSIRVSGEKARCRHATCLRCQPRAVYFCLEQRARRMIFYVWSQDIISIFRDVRRRLLSGDYFDASLSRGFDGDAFRRYILFSSEFTLLGY